MTKKNDAPTPYEREMTAGEIAADEAHKAAHARAIAEERERNEIIKDRIAKGDIDPSIAPDQLPVTPQDNAVKASDVFKTNAEQHGGATGPAVEEVPASTRSKK